MAMRCALKETDSSTLHTTVRSRRAPMFSTLALRRAASAARAAMPSGVKSSATP